MNLTCQKHLFDIPDDITYLNGAYMSPLLKQVAKAGEQGISHKTQPWNLTIDDFFEPTVQLKKTIAQLLYVNNPERIALLPAVSYGIANVANNIKANGKKEILIVGEQFPSNYYSWERLAKRENLSIKIITAPDINIGRGKAWNEKILNTINEDTLVVSMSNVHWADGTVFDLKAIRKRTKNVEALLVIDGTQSVGALPFNVSEIQPDALICAAYKWLMGPYSSGFAYYGDYFDNGIPIEESWLNRLNSEDFANLVNYQEQYKPAANRYMVGEYPNFILVPMMQTALEQILEWDVNNIQNYCKKIAKPVIHQLREKGYSIEEDPYLAYHLFGIKFSSINDAKKVQHNLTEKRIFVSRRNNAIRISPNIYNDESDLNNLLEILAQ